MQRHKFIPSMMNTANCVVCRNGKDAAEHADTRYEAAPRSAPLGEEHPMPQRMAAMEHEKIEILMDQKNRNADRIARAQELAKKIHAETGEPVMVWQVYDRWQKEVEPELSWRDDNGKTYWAGAIFNKREWDCVGTGKSPLNHNTSNSRWVAKGKSA